MFSTSTQCTCICSIGGQLSTNAPTEHRSSKLVFYVCTKESLLVGRERERETTLAVVDREGDGRVARNKWSTPGWVGGCC